MQLRSQAGLERYMKITNPKQLESGTPGIETESPAGDDFLGRVRGTIIEFKEVLKIVQEMRDMSAGGSQEPGPEPPGPGQNKAALVNYLTAAVRRGYGDTTIEALLKQMGPCTLKQVLEFIKRV